MVNSVGQNYCASHCCIRPEKFDGTNFKPGLRPPVSNPKKPKAQEAYPGEKQELEAKLMQMLEIMKAAQTHATKSAQNNGKNLVTINYGSKFEQDLLKLIMRLDALNGVEKPKFPTVIYNCKPRVDATSKEFETYVSGLKKDYPDSTSTVEEKQRAISHKQKILAHPDCPQKIAAILQQEIKAIQDEIKQMQ